MASSSNTRRDMMDLDIQDLIDTGTARKLEGSVGRACMAAIGDNQAIPSQACRHQDYWGNYVPSRVRGRAGHEGVRGVREARDDIDADYADFCARSWLDRPRQLEYARPRAIPARAGAGRAPDFDVLTDVRKPRAAPCRDPSRGGNRMTRAIPRHREAGAYPQDGSRAGTVGASRPPTRPTRPTT